MPKPVLTDMKTRITKAAIDVDDARKAYRDAVERRDELIETAVDEGMGVRAVSHAADLTHARVIQIVLKRSAVDVV